MTDLIEKHHLINEAEGEWVAAQVKAGVSEADAVAALRAARVGPAAEWDGDRPARHIPGGEAPSEPTGGLTEIVVEEVEPEPAEVVPETVTRREKNASAPGVPAEASNKEASNG